MFTRKRQRKAPRHGHQSPLQLLVGDVETRVAAEGITREPSGPWIAGAELYLRLQASCRPLAPHETPEWVVATRLDVRGPRCHWESDELVVALSGWTPPELRFLAIQPDLFQTQGRCKYKVI